MPIGNRSTPTIIEIKYMNYTEVPIKDGIEYTFYVNGDEYKELPLDANVRLPEVNKSTPYKDMCNALKNNPENFFENNLGISIIAEKVELVKTSNKAILTFKSGTGIINGGHTQQAILDTQDIASIKDATIKLIIKMKSYTLERLAEIAACQNTSTQVKEYCLAEKKGYFAKLKGCMGENYEKHIVWYQGRQVPNEKGMIADDLIAIINLFNIKLYDDSYKQPTNSATSKKATFDRWQNNTDEYSQIYPLIDDILDLYEYIQLNFHNKTGISKLNVVKENKNKTGKKLIFSLEKPEYLIPKQFLYPILASFRSNVYYDSTNKKIGWYEDNKTLFDRSKKDLCKRLSQTYKSTYHSEINRASKDSNLWQILYQQVSSMIDKDKVYKKYDICI